MITETLIRLLEKDPLGFILGTLGGCAGLATVSFFLVAGLYHIITYQEPGKKEDKDE